MSLPQRIKACSIMLVLALLFSTGCQTTTTVLMKTPNIYVGHGEVFNEVPESQRNTDVKVLYGTDRAPALDKQGALKEPIEYTYQRSHALACGIATVSLDSRATWDELVQASMTQNRERNYYPRLVEVEQSVEWPPTNNRYVPDNLFDTEIMLDEILASGETRARRQFCQLFETYGDSTEPQPVYLFIHGYNTDFTYATVTMAQIWHFLGRKGIPAVYSWPAGRGGPRGYMFDRESGEFTIFHLKQFLRTMAACENVSEINIIAHSRGTDVAISALRELHLEISGNSKDSQLTQRTLKLNHVILAAPDLDMQVVAQRVAAEGLLGVPNHFLMYISPDDRAILLATWLFNSVKRIGMLRATDLEPQQQQLIENMPRLEVIEAAISRTDFFGHGYFYRHPAVSSDLVLVLKDNKLPGIDNGRPLEQYNGMYVLKPGYPDFTIEQK